MSELSASIEAILFVASEPVTLGRLAKVTGHDESAVTAALHELIQLLADTGLRLTRHHDAYRLVTAPEASELVRDFLTEDARTELSKPALEALAIVAYRGPLTKSKLDEIRGVSSDATLKNLLQRGLVAEHGTAPETGHPTLYAVSQAFLQEFGFGSIDELPPLQETEVL